MKGGLSGKLVKIVVADMELKRIAISLRNEGCERQSGSVEMTGKFEPEYSVELIEQDLRSNEV